jgi:hypothetical protein
MMNLVAIADKIEKKSIEQYAHKGKRSVNNPPVGGEKKKAEVRHQEGDHRDHRDRGGNRQAGPVAMRITADANRR